MNKQKHLEFIEAIISRMSSNLFMLKGWAITIMVATLTFLSNETNKDYTFFICSIVLVFWILDGFFLSKERCFRGLYNHVRKLKESEIDFNMNCKEFEKEKNTWIRSMFSSTLTIFYGSLLLITIISTRVDTLTILIRLI